MVLEYISDSDDQHDALDTSVLSPHRMASILSSLPQEQRDVTTEKLRVRYLSLLSSSEWQNPSLVNSRQERQNTTITHSSQERQDTTINHSSQQIIYDIADTISTSDSHLQETSPTNDIPSVSRQQQSSPQEQPQPTIPAQEQEHENNTNLKLYLDARNYEIPSSRRGLRKRKFASTHPYLADQVHYLGLTSISYLNELYDVNQDLELMVKFLNYSYIKLKQSNPKDEKYKSKNFYTILGMQSAIARMKEKESQQDSQNPEREYIESQIPASQAISNRSDDEQFSDSSDSQRRDNNELRYYVNTGNYEDLTDIQNFSDNTDISDDESLIRVGGRYVKERNLLRGALPESAKRLDLYKKPKKNYKGHSMKQVEHRKGLAVKKKSTGRPQSGVLLNELNEFVDENNYQDEDIQLYKKFDTSHEVMSDFDTPLKGIDTFGILSETSSEEEFENFAEDFFESHRYDKDESHGRLNTHEQNPISSEDTSNLDERRHFVNDTGDDLNQAIDLGYDIEEDDEINPMFSYREHRSNPRTYKKRKLEPTKQSKLKIFNSRNRKSPGPENSPKFTNSRTVHRSISEPRSTPQKRRKATSSGAGLPSNSSYVSKPTKRSSLFAVFGNLQKKKVAFPTSKKKSRKPASRIGQQILPTSKELLKSSYTFLRSPAQYTIAFEAESEDKFVKNNNNFKQPSLRNDMVQRIIKNSMTFPSGFILNTIDIKRIWQINEGKSYNFTQDRVAVTLMSERFLFTLLDTSQARINFERLLVSILKVLRDPALFSLDHISNQLYEAIKGILLWTLISKEPPSEKVWKYCRNCLLILSQQRNFEHAGKSKVFYPYFILIYFTFTTISKTSTFLQPTLKDEETLFQLCLQYWILFFFDGSFAAMDPNSKQFESFSIMYTIHNLHKKWWELIDHVIDQITTEVDLEIVLEVVASLAAFVPVKNYKWTILYSIYGKISTSEDSRIYHGFLDVVVLLNQRYSWPLEEKLLLLLYSTITSRKFSNFDDEYGVPELLGKIQTRNDIPDTTYFERFMYLFYNYVSELPTTANKKRLITKLITSSHYQYKEDRSHFGMFVNRLNFLLLLQQVSQVDLKNQLYDLLQRIIPSNDAEILMVSVQALQLFLELSISTGNGIPVNCFVLLINKVMDCYLVMAGVVKIWKLMVSILEKLVFSSTDLIFQFLDITRKISSGYQGTNNYEPSKSKSSSERILNDIQRLTLKAIDEINSQQTLKIDQINIQITPKRLEILQKNYERNYKFLHYNMGRLPLPSVTEEAKLEELIEVSIKIWVRTSHLLPNVNWDVITLQRFPYTGNTQLRGQFILFFYIELLKFTSLKNCKDNILKSLIRSIVSFTPSKYAPQLLNQLNKEKNEVVIFQRRFIPEEVTPFFMLNFRLQLVSNILLNISKSTRTEVVTKRIYLEEILKTMNSEYDRYFSSTWYKEFCIGLVKAIQKYCREVISDDSTVIRTDSVVGFRFTSADLSKNSVSDLVRTTASKLGILQHELDKYNWLSKPLRQRLSFLHQEFTNALHFQKDYASVLRSYTFSEGTDMIFHLMSIYSKAVMMHQTDKWRLLFVLVDFFSLNLSLFKFDIFNVSFKKFLRLLVDIPKLPKPATYSDNYFRLKACIAVGDILNDSIIIFDGYKDIDFVQSSINSFMDNFEADKSSINFYSSFKLFDIQEVRNELAVPGVEVGPDDIDELHMVLESKKERLKNQISLSDLVTEKCLPVDLQF